MEFRPGGTVGPCRPARSGALLGSDAATDPRTATPGVQAPLSARARPSLPVGVPLARLPDPRPHRSARDPSRFRIVRGPGATVLVVPLAGAVAALAGKLEHRALAAGLGGSRRLDPAHAQRLAPRRLRDLHGPLPLLRRRGAGLLLVSVGRDAPRGGFSLPLLRPRRPAPGPRRARSPFPPRALPSPLGMVPHLLRVGDRQAGERRRAVADPDRPGPLLRERAAPDLSRLVRATDPAARLPRRLLRGRLPLRVRHRLAGLRSAPVEALVLLPRLAVPGRDHPHRQLRLPELPGSLPRRAAPRRSVPRTGGAATARRGAASGSQQGRRHPPGRGARLRLRRHPRRGAPRAEGFAPPAPLARDRACALPHRQRLWALRGDDQGAVRDRVPGLSRRKNVDAVSLPLQAPGSGGRPGNLRSLPAAIRLEPVVRLARDLPRVPLGGADRGAPARRGALGAAPLRLRPLPRKAAC